MRVYVAGSGDVILVEEFAPPEAVNQRADAGTLFTATEAAAWFGEAVAAGITFEALTAASAALIRRGWRRKSKPSSADQITGTVTRYLDANGFTGVVFSDVRRVDGRGWTFSGRLDDGTFRGLTDLDGNLIHVRVR